MNEPVRDDKGNEIGKVGDHLRVAARNGNARAQAELDGPEFPEALEYLWGWYLEAAQGASEGWNGSALGYADLQAWMRLMDRHPSPVEVGALIALHHALRSPGKDEGETAKPLPAWPDKKA